MLYSTSIGLDVHARSISAAAFVFETGEVVQRTFGYDPDAVAAWARSLPQPAGCLYESGPTGFDLKRRLDALGLPCHVGAVSKMVRPSGDRVKTDRRDALFLSRLLAVGEFVECAPPAPAMEAARDLSRAREDAREALMRARHQLSKFLLRKGHVWPRGRSTWTRAHREWLRSIELADPCERLVLEEYVAQVRECEERRDRLDAAIAERSRADDLAGVTSRLRALRGVSTVTAFGVATEIGDFSRFPGPRRSCPTSASCRRSRRRASRPRGAGSPRRATRTSGGCSSRPPGTTPGPSRRPRRPTPPRRRGSRRRRRGSPRGRTGGCTGGTST